MRWIFSKSSEAFIMQHNKWPFASVPIIQFFHNRIKLLYCN